MNPAAFALVILSGYGPGCGSVRQANGNSVMGIPAQIPQRDEGLKLFQLPLHPITRWIVRLSRAFSADCER